MHKSTFDKFKRNDDSLVEEREEKTEIFNFLDDTSRPISQVYFFPKATYNVVSMQRPKAM